MSGSAPPGSFWPSPLQRSLLEVTLGPVEQAAERWRGLQPLDLTTLEPGSLALLPLLHERLTEVVPDEPQLPRLAGTYRSIWYRNRLLLDRLAVVLRLLRERVPTEPLLVGGMSAALRWYPRLGLRPVPQLELIVEPEVVAEAVKVAGYAGWQPSGQTRFLTRLCDESRRTLVIHHGATPAIVGPLRALHEHALTLDRVEEAPLVLDAGDEFLLTCATGARAAPVPTCAWLIDVYHLLRSGEAPTPEALLERARPAHLVAPVRATVRYLGGVVEDDVPAPYLGAFDAEPVRRRDRVAFTLAGVGGNRAAGAAHVLAAYLRATAEDPTLRAISRLPRYLQERWGLPSRRRVPALVLWKTLRLLLPRVQTPTAGRNRSASS